MNPENKKPANPNAFPTRTEHEDPLNPIYSGMTLRDHFAGLAMQGIISNNEEIIRIKHLGFETNIFIAGLSYSIADAMLKQREL